jgi:two-component system sensor histidine kinase/response regulator
MRGYLLWAASAALIAAYCLIDVPIVKAALVVGLSVVAMAFAAWSAPAGKLTRVYLLTVTALGLWAAGWIGWEVAIVANGAPPTASSLVNLLFLGGSFALFLALLAALCDPEGRAVGVLDVATIAASLLVVAWAAILHNYTSASLSDLETAVQIAYAVVDVLLVAAALRLLVAPRGRGRSLVLAPAALALVVSDLLWNWSTALGTYAPGSWADAGWLAWAVLGAYAARRSSHQIATGVGSERRAGRYPHGRIVLLTVSALVCPTVLTVEIIGDKGIDTALLVIGGAVIALLVIAGLAMLVRTSIAVHARAAEIASLVEASGDAVIGSTPAGIITSWNPGAEFVYGWTAQETIGNSLEMIVPPSSRSAVGASMRQLALGTTAIRHNAEGLHRDGRHIDVALTVCPVFAAGRLVAVSTVARDISAAVEAEAERDQLLAALAEQNERLREVDRMKDEFVASVSHELRTPLTSIRGYLELVREDDALSDEHDQMLGVIERNAERLLLLVNDLLLAAQVAAGNEVSVAFADFDLARLVNDAVAAASPRADQGHVAITVDTEPATLRGDAVRIAQVTDNLISNAIKFTPPGGAIRVVLARADDGITLSVSDSGMGIPEDEQAGLFSRFFRSKAATKEAIPGTGLGLAIAKSIVDAHGGSITFTSVAAIGTTFVVTLPHAPQASRPPAIAALA